MSDRSQEAIRQVIEPMQRDTRSLVKELLGDGGSDRQTCLCEMSVMGQCFGPTLRLRRARIAPDVSAPGSLPFEVGVEELADHVLRFSLAGIRGIREEPCRERSYP